MTLRSSVTVGFLFGLALGAFHCSKDKAALCTPCTKDSDCASGSCLTGLCWQLSSSSSANACPFPMLGSPPNCTCKPEAGDGGVCSACNADSQCASGLVCDLVTSQCTRSCTSAASCPPPSTCDANHQCSCPGPSPDGGADAGSDGGILPGADGGVCALCFDDSNCGPGFICAGWQCISGCGANSSCPAPATCSFSLFCSCKAAQCAPCLFDAQCGPGMLCDPVSHECLGFCGPNGSCPAPATCNGNGLCTCPLAGGDAGATPTYAASLIPPFLGSSSTNAAAVTPLGLFAGGLSGSVATLVSLEPRTGNQRFTRLLAFDGGTAQFSVMAPAQSGAGLFLGGAISGSGGVLYPAFFNFDFTGNLLWGVQGNGISGQVGGAWPLPGGQVLTSIQGSELEVFTIAAAAPTQVQRLQASGPAGAPASISAIASGPLGVAVLGVTQGNAAVSLYDNTLSTLQWERLLTADGGSGGLGSAAVGSDGIYAAGTTTAFGAGRGDIWAVKLDPSGSLLWQKTLGTSSWDYGGSIALVGDAGVLVTGSASNLGLAALLDPQTGSLITAEGYGSNNLTASVGVPNGSGFFLFMSDNTGGAYYLSTDSNLRIPSCVDPTFAGVDAGIILGTSTATADPTQGITLADAGVAALTGISPDVGQGSSTVIQQCQ